jgi:hypothetical protein
MTYTRPCQHCGVRPIESKDMTIGADGMPVYTCRVVCLCAAGEYVSDDKRAATRQARRRYWDRIQSREAI